MIHSKIKISLERDRARLVKRLSEAQAGRRGIGDISVGYSYLRRVADYQDAIDRIDQNLRILGHADPA